jgi:DNA-binding transcriptional ArsR family regulator
LPWSHCDGGRPDGDLDRHLAAGEQRVAELAAPLPVSRSAVSQHLRLILDAGVVSERWEGRERYYRLRRDRLNEIDRWLGRLDQFWARGLRRLGEHLDTQS